MKKGFTLLELLAVIVVLAIIALIVTPFVSKAIDNAKRGAFKNCAYGMISSGELYYGKKLTKNDNSETVIQIDEYVINENTFNYKGSKIESAYLEINQKGQTKMYMWNGGFCATKDFNDTEVTVTKKPKEECNLVGPVAPALVETNPNTCVANSKTVTISDPMPNVKYYYYLSNSAVNISNGSWIEVINNLITIDTVGTNYLYVRGVKDNVVGTMSSSPIEICIDNAFYPITINTVTGGTVTSSKSTAQIGEEITFNVSSATGYRINSLTSKTNTNVSTNITSTNKINMTQGGITVTPAWSKLSYLITKSSGTGGSITVSPVDAQGKGTYGATITVGTSPSANYALNSLTYTAGGITTTITSNKTFTMPASAVTVTATWRLTTITKYRTRTYNPPGSSTNNCGSWLHASCPAGGTITNTICSINGDFYPGACSGTGATYYECECRTYWGASNGAWGNWTTTPCSPASSPCTTMTCVCESATCREDSPATGCTAP